MGNRLNHGATFEKCNILHAISSMCGFESNILANPFDHEINFSRQTTDRKNDLIFSIYMHTQNANTQFQFTLLSHA